MRLECAQRVAAGGDQRLHAFEVEWLGILERDAQQRLHRRLVAVFLQRRSQLERIGFRTSDEQAHRLDWGGLDVASPRLKGQSGAADKDYRRSDTFTWCASALVVGTIAIPDRMRRVTLLLVSVVGRSSLRC